MKKFIYSSIAIFAFINSSFAVSAHNHDHNHDHSNETLSTSLSDSKQIKKADCKNIVNIKVNGLVCDFCARAVEKVFSKKEEVSAINVDLDNGKITIAMKDNKSINDEDLTKLIKDSGYDLVKIDRGCNE